MKISLYFIFYVALILELLIFIVDRDDAEAEVDQALAIFISDKTQPPQIQAPESIPVQIGKNRSVAVLVKGLQSAREKKAVYFELDTSKVKGAHNISMIADPAGSGNGILKADYDVAGDQLIGIRAYVEHDVTEIANWLSAKLKRPLSPHLIERLRKSPRAVENKTQPFAYVKVSTSAKPLPLRIGIENVNARNSSLHALEGVPYERELRVSGVDASQVSLSGLSPLEISERGFGFIKLRWAKPHGKINLNLIARSSILTGTSYDFATLPFSIEATPPRWDTDPCGNIFRKVKKAFTSSMTSLTLGTDYMIRMTATDSDGDTLEHSNNYAFFEFTPDSLCASVTFTPILLNGDTIRILERKCDVPPCPLPDIVFKANQVQAKGADGIAQFQFRVNDQTGTQLTPDAQVISPLGLRAFVSGANGSYQLKISNINNFAGDVTVKINVSNECNKDTVKSFQKITIK